MNMSYVPTLIDDFHSYLSELDADPEDFRDNYPKVYAALLAMFTVEQAAAIDDVADSQKANDSAPDPDPAATAGKVVTPF